MNQPVYRSAIAGVSALQAISILLIFLLTSSQYMERFFYQVSDTVIPVAFHLSLLYEEDGYTGGAECSISITELSLILRLPTSAAAAADGMDIHDLSCR